jgi:nucleoside phosphorylase
MSAAELSGRISGGSHAVIGVVTGLEAEAQALFPGVGVEMAAGPGKWRLVETDGVAVAIACLGIGKVAAAAAATFLACRVGVSALMVVGTAGRLVPGDSEPRWLRSAVQHDYGAVHEEDFVHYDAGSMPIGPSLLRPWKALGRPAGVTIAEATIASGDAFIACSRRAASLRDRMAADMVDMETAAVAQAAHLLSLPWCGIKAATDDANAASAGDFHDNLQRAARRAAACAEGALPYIIDALAANRELISSGRR